MIHVSENFRKPLSYLQNSSQPLERSAEFFLFYDAASSHITLATQPFQVIAKPGMGIDEGYQIVMNEMMRTVALITQR